MKYYRIFYVYNSPGVKSKKSSLKVAQMGKITKITADDVVRDLNKYDKYFALEKILNVKEMTCEDYKKYESI